MLNIEADEYLSDFSESYGAIVDVVDAQKMHFPEENGYLITPGQVTNIGFTKVSLVLKHQPHIKDYGSKRKEVGESSPS